MRSMQASPQEVAAGQGAEAILETIHGLALPEGGYFIIGGANLVLRGVRDQAQDIDMLVDSPVYREMARLDGATISRSSAGRRYPGANSTVHLDPPLVEVSVDATVKLGQPHYPLNFYRHRRITEMVQGVPCLALSEIMASKEALGREKDLADLELITRFLGKTAGLPQPA